MRLSFSLKQIATLRHRLFVKIMLVIWLTFIAAISINTILTKQISKLEINAKHINEQIERLAEDAVNVYEEEGKRSLMRWYRHRYKQQEIGLILLDNQKHPIGHPVWKPKKSHHDKDEVGFKFRRPLPINRLVKVTGKEGNVYWLQVLPSPFLWKQGYDPRKYIWLRFIVTFMLIGLASWWLTRIIGRPVQQLKETSQHMAQGNLNSRVPDETTRRKDELGELGKSFNQMANKVEEMLAQQKQLIRDISHEIKTPLTRQRLAISLVKDQGQNDKLWQQIENQNIKLAELINNLLTFHQLSDEQGHSHFALSKLNPDEVVANCLNEAEFEAQEKQISLNYQHGDTKITLMGNAGLLSSAIENLLRNAIKYSPENSHIQVNSQLKQGQWTLIIEDEGGGVPESQLPHLFTPFYRVDAARATPTGGHGLGLAIVQQVVAQHGGKVVIENVPDQKGKPKGLRVSIIIPV